MRTAPALAFAVAIATGATLSISASAVEVCDENCVGPICSKECVSEPNVTVGRSERNKVMIKERNRRTGPIVVIEERGRPAGDNEAGR
jgi:hypothetical protein